MPLPKKIINDAADGVGEFIEGLLLQHPNHMVKLQNHHVVLAADRGKQVQLISGGGSGHEPSHAGWLGQGMLSAAVCGDIFASPSVRSVLAAIRAADQGMGCLLIVKNYTGDRLNFGMAAEKANQEGIHCEMVVVADDCAIPRTKGITGARGVAGTVFIHKIAGAAAAQGKSLDEVAALANHAASRMGSLGVALNSVTVPGADEVNTRLDENTIEIGLGIHGEAGMKQSPLLTANEMARVMIEQIQKHGRDVMDDDGEESIVPIFNKGDQLAVLVNNLGGTSNFEMSILARSCVKLLESDEFGAKATRVMVGTYMTSFDMHGVSLSIFNVTGQDELLDLLDAPTNAPAWAKCSVWKSGDQRPSSTELPEVVVDEKAADMVLPPLEIANFGATAKNMIVAVIQKLVESEHILTKYDTIVGDGDCGIALKRGALEVKERLSNGSIPVDHPVSMFAALADAVSASMGGTLGILMEMMFRKFSSMLARAVKIGPAEFSRAVQSGVRAVSFYGGAQIGARTMLDALIPATVALIASNSLADAAAKAKEGADGTAAMKTASAGRSNYLSEETLEGTPDPGAVAVAIVLESLAKDSA
jgi:dihydroxyacetone kinase